MYACLVTNESTELSEAHFNIIWLLIWSLISIDHYRSRLVHFRPHDVFVSLTARGLLAPRNAFSKLVPSPSNLTIFRLTSIESLCPLRKRGSHFALSSTSSSSLVLAVSTIFSFSFFNARWFNKQTLAVLSFMKKRRVSEIWIKPLSLNYLFFSNF